MLSPKNMKYRKPHRRRLWGNSSCGTAVSFGDYGFRSIELSWLNSRQIESRRRVLIRYVRRRGTIWIRVFPDKAMTARPIETRIGAGKGRLRYYATEIYPGTIIFEICRISEFRIIQAMRVVISKLPIRIQITIKLITSDLFYDSRTNIYIRSR